MSSTEVDIAVVFWEFTIWTDAYELVEDAALYFSRIILLLDFPWTPDTIIRYFVSLLPSA